MKKTIFWSYFLVIVLGFAMVSCQKDDDEPEKIISTQEVVRNGNVIVEASYRNELRKMYFILVSPNTAVVTRAVDFNPQLINREYYRKVVIPSEFEHMSQTYTVVGIKEGTFSYCKKLISLVMPNTITSVGPQAFSGCAMLESLVLSDQLESIEELTFCGCMQIKSVEIPASVERINWNAFNYCTSLKTVVCQSNTPPFMAPNAFSDCPIQEIKVPQASVAAYKGSDGWREYEDKIVGY